MSEQNNTYPSAAEDIAQRLSPPPSADGRETVTALIICCDNERTIRACMESVRWCDEILVVIDPRSTDATRSIISEYTDRIFENVFTSDGVQRNFAIPKASCDWIFVVDSDEYITAELRDEILARLASKTEYEAFYVKRIAYFLGKPIKYCGWGKEDQLRLFRRDKGRYDTRRIHAGVQVIGKTGSLKGFMHHDTIRDLEGYLNRFNDFTTWTSADLHDSGKRFSMSRLTLRPLIRFLKMYVFKLGFLEGKRGLMLCGFAAFSVFTKYAKLWELENVETVEKQQKQ